MKKNLLMLVVVFMAMFLAGLSQVGVAAAPQGALVEWKADGIITENEYSKSQQIGKVEVSTRIEGDTIMIGLRAQTTGYIALGIDPEQIMKGADIISVYVKDGKAFGEDMYSIGIFGPHPPDIKQGGTMDIEGIGGTEKDGWTIVEFKRKLATGDKLDKPLKKGENKVIWALGDSDDVFQKHSARGSGVLSL